MSERLDNLERKVDSRGLIDLLNRVDQLQRDIQQLRGAIEVQNHSLEEIQRRQREQYLDVDRRLQLLETGQPAAPVAGAADGGQTGMPVMAPEHTAAPGGVPAAGHAPADPTPPSTADPATEQAEYDTALAVLRDGRYSDAALAFNQFITRYPSGPLTDNAYYWLGETYYVTRDFDRALTTFTQLTETYPNSPKAPDSYLKTGYIYYEQQNWPDARQALDTVVSGYPGTTAARLAADRLQRMKKEGH